MNRKGNDLARGAYTGVAWLIDDWPSGEQSSEQNQLITVEPEQTGSLRVIPWEVNQHAKNNRGSLHIRAMVC